MKTGGFWWVMADNYGRYGVLPRETPPCLGPGLLAAWCRRWRPSGVAVVVVGDQHDLAHVEWRCISGDQEEDAKLHWADSGRQYLCLLATELRDVVRGALNRVEERLRRQAELRGVVRRRCVAVRTLALRLAVGDGLHFDVDRLAGEDDRRLVPQAQQRGVQ